MKVLCFLLLLVVKISFTFAEKMIRAVPAATTNTVHKFEWFGMGNGYLDPRIMFWQKGSHPSIDKNYLEKNWRFTYGGDVAQKEYSTDFGSIEIPTPEKPGLYSAFYCYTNTKDELECLEDNKIEVAVINCRGDGLVTSSTIEHIIIIISENHSFDSIYGSYCQAETNSNPTCGEGPKCCEKAPSQVNGISPYTLTDDQNALFDPCHHRDCEESEINGGKMDKFIIGGIGSDKRKFAVASGSEDSAAGYFSMAKNGAMFDRFFQSVPGGSWSNDMYFAAGKYFFTDNTVAPQGKFINGAKCYNVEFQTFYDPTIADLLNTCKITWTFYAEGYDEYPTDKQCWPQYFNAADLPFLYFWSLTNSQTSEFNFRDLNKLETDLVEGMLPSVSSIKGLGIHSEHPGLKGGFTSGQELNKRVVDMVQASALYAKNTVVILVPDESGGYYDHVSPPKLSTVDGVPYGPRTQCVAVGYQVKQNYISHTQTEPSSLIKFIEWNWLAGTGQLEKRDAVVNNIGDLFDPEKTGVIVPNN